MRLRHFLVLMFFALTLIPVAVFRAWPDSAVFKTELEEVHERHLLLARNLAAALERYHQDVSNTFRLVVSAPEIWQVSDRIADTLSDLGLTHICIADGATGVILHRIGAEQTFCPENVPKEFLQRFVTLEPSSVTFTEVAQAADGRNVLQLLKRLDDGRIAFGDLRTDYFVELGQAISFGKMGHAAIVDHAGNVLFHPQPDWRATRQNIANISVVQRMMNGETESDIFYSPALKSDMIAGFTGVALSGGV